MEPNSGPEGRRPGVPDPSRSEPAEDALGPGWGRVEGVVSLLSQWRGEGGEGCCGVRG